MKKVGLYLALAALLVNGPRFVIIFLKVDSIDLPKTTEAALLTATGIATGLVLTGGGAFIAHSLAESKVRGPMQWFMILCWFLLLIFSVVLLAPLMVAAIAESPLNTVLVSKFSQWLWSITSVLAVEVIAAGSMVAFALHGRADDDYQKDNGPPSAFSILSGAFVKRLESSIAPQPSNTTNVRPEGAVTVSTNSSHDEQSRAQPPLLQQAKPEKKQSKKQPTGKEVSQSNAAETGDADDDLSSNGQKQQFTKSERQGLLLHLLNSLSDPDGIRVDKLADRLACSSQTVYRDIAELKKHHPLDMDEGRVAIIKTSN